MGRTEEDAIDLLDDDDEEEEDSKPASVEGMTVAQPEDRYSFRVYKIFLHGPRLGLIFHFFKKRIVVSGISEARKAVSGKGSRPWVGDILVAFNNRLVPPQDNMRGVLEAICSCLKASPIEFCFATDPTFTQEFQEHLILENARKRELARAKVDSNLAVVPGDVIEIDD